MSSADQCVFRFGLPYGENACQLGLRSRCPTELAISASVCCNGFGTVRGGMNKVHVTRVGSPIDALGCSCLSSGGLPSNQLGERSRFDVVGRGVLCDCSSSSRPVNCCAFLRCGSGSLVPLRGPCGGCFVKCARIAAARRCRGRGVMRASICCGRGRGRPHKVRSPKSVVPLGNQLLRRQICSGKVALGRGAIARCGYRRLSSCLLKFGMSANCPPCGCQVSRCRVTPTIMFSALCTATNSQAVYRPGGARCSCR